MFIIYHLRRLGTVIIYIRLVFVVPGPLPNEKDIMQVANNLLSSLPATKLNTKTEALSDPVSFVNVTYMRKFFFPLLASFCCESCHF